MRETPTQAKKRALKIVRRLRSVYPDAECALTSSGPFQLLVATILSAQCTDKRVNMVTPELFKAFPDAPEFAAAKLSDVERLIRSTGFYKHKARNIVETAKLVVERHGGKVPDKLEELVRLPGIGRKTANVVLGNAFGIPGLTVDTHMIRLNNRLGLTKDKDPVKIEFALMKIIPRKDWTMYSHYIIHHGRARCSARKPDCGNCELSHLCPSAGKC